MKLIKLKLASFRNLQNIELAPGKKFNVFYGNNGQGNDDKVKDKNK